MKRQRGENTLNDGVANSRDIFDSTHHFGVFFLYDFESSGQDPIRTWRSLTGRPRGTFNTSALNDVKNAQRKWGHPKQLCALLPRLATGSPGCRTTGTSETHIRRRLLLCALPEFYCLALAAVKRPYY